MLTAAGMAVERHRIDDLAHGIDDEGLDLAGRFLERVLAARAEP